MTGDFTKLETVFSLSIIKHVRDTVIICVYPLSLLHSNYNNPNIKWGCVDDEVQVDRK